MDRYTLNFIHLCDEANFTQDGKLNLTGIFDVINAIEVPSILPKAKLVANFSIHGQRSSEIPLVVEIINKQTQEAMLKTDSIIMKIDTNNPAQNASVGIMLDILNVTFAREGTYEVRVVVDGGLVGNKLITVTKIGVAG